MTHFGRSSQISNRCASTLADRPVRSLLLEHPPRYRGLEQTARKLAEHEKMPSRREMFIAMDEETVVPVFVNVLLGEESREQIDEFLTILDTKRAPDRDLAALAIVVEELVRPGIYYERQGDPVRSQEIRQFLHVLRSASNPAFHPQRQQRLVEC